MSNLHITDFGISQFLRNTSANDTSNPVYAAKTQAWLLLNIMSDQLSGLPANLTGITLPTDVQKAFQALQTDGQSFQALADNIVALTTDIQNYAQDSVSGLWEALIKIPAGDLDTAKSSIINNYQGRCDNNIAKIGEVISSLKLLPSKAWTAAIQALPGLISHQESTIAGTNEKIKQLLDEIAQAWQKVWSLASSASDNFANFFEHGILVGVDAVAIGAEIADEEPPSADEVKSFIEGTIDVGKAFVGMVESAVETSKELNTIDNDMKQLMQEESTLPEETLVLGFLHNASQYSSNFHLYLADLIATYESITNAWQAQYDALENLKNADGLGGLTQDDLSKLANDWTSLETLAQSFATNAYITPIPSTKVTAKSGETPITVSIVALPPSETIKQAKEMASKESKVGVS